MMSQPEPKLKRAVSRWEIVGIAINDVVGSGIYLLPAAAAALLGVMSIGAILLAGLAVSLLVLCFAEASSYFEETGGGYVYTREAFGDFIGFEVGWMTWVARVVSVASLSAGFAMAVSFFWPEANSGWERVLVITLLLAVLAWINIIGVKEGSRVAVAFTITKSVPLFIFVIAGIFYVDWSTFEQATFSTGGNFAEAALLLLFAYAGFENTPAVAGEYKNPKRDVPFAMLTMIAFVTITYVLVQFVAVGTFPGLAESESPLADAAVLFMGAGGGILMSIGAIISIGGNTSNTTLIGPRYLFALARDGYGPKIFGRIHPTYRTPAVAIVVQTSLALILALSGSFVQLAMLSIIARLATYIGTVAAIPVLRRKFGKGENTFQTPGGYLIPLLAFGICLIFLTSTTTVNLIAGGVALVVGAIIYRFRGSKLGEAETEVEELG